MMTRNLFLAVTLSLACFALPACGGGDDGGDDTTGDDTGDDSTGDDSTGDDSSGDDSGDDSTPACGDIAGTWAISGACGADLCTITQVGCGITEVDCTSGTHSTSGDVDGDDFSYDGVSGEGVPATCSGTIAGDAIAGQCVGVAGTCAFTGARQ